MDRLLIFTGMSKFGEFTDRELSDLKTFVVAHTSLPAAALDAKAGTTGGGPISSATFVVDLTAVPDLSWEQTVAQFREGTSTPEFARDVATKFDADNAPLMGWAFGSADHMFDTIDFYNGLELEGQPDPFEDIYNYPVQDIVTMDETFMDEYAWSIPPAHHAQYVILRTARYELYATYDPEGNGPAYIETVRDGLISADNTLLDVRIKFDGSQSHVIYFDGQESELLATNPLTGENGFWVLADRVTGNSYGLETAS